MRREWLKMSLTGILLSSLLLSGCGNSSVEEEAVTLIEPVSTVSNSETPAYRNIYNATTYTTSVYPETKEYTFNTNSTFNGYGAFPGQKVSAGESLAYTKDSDIEDQIKAMQERISGIEKTYQEYVADMGYTIQKSDKRMADAQRLGGPYMKDYYIESLINKAYKDEYNYKEQIYNLDIQYYTAELKKLEDKKKEYSVVATSAGNVVAIQLYEPGNYVTDETKVMAIGNLDKKELKCEYINKGTITKADDVYAIFNGVKYEIEYETMDTDEYTKLHKQNIPVYSTFHFKDETPDIKIGDFGVIVVVTDKAEQVLSISNSAIHRDISNTYVYVLKDGVNVQTSVKVGVTDGVYTEILSGITKDDKVLIDEMKTYGTNTATVSKGDFSNQLKEFGWMYYPDNTGVINQNEYGTMYLQEMKVERYQHVEKGDVICTVHVVPDTIALERAQAEMQREQERLQDLLDSAERVETKEEIISREKQTARRVDEIAKIQEKLDKMQSCNQTVALYAPRTGVVVWTTDFETQSVISKDTMVAQIANEENCYVVMQDENNQLNYGNTVEVGYDNPAGGMTYLDGTVVTMSNAGVSQELRIDYALIQLPRDQISEIASAVFSDGSGWSNFDINATIREMKNVLIVPKKAVTEVNGHTYVDVMDENGNVVSTSFIYGGFNNDNYWVVEGLTEGMKICLK